MKRILLSVTAFMLVFSALSQSSRVNEKYRDQKKKHFFPELASEPVVAKTNVLPAAEPVKRTSKGTNAVSILDIGGSANGYGLYNGGRACLWADDDLNAVTFVHRMPVGGAYGGSRIGFDVSVDGGANWFNNVLCYEPLGPGSPYPQAAGRYPQGGIYNPNGSSNPSDAYLHYFIPTLDGTNGDSWGGYGHGVRRLDTLMPFTQHNLTSHDGYLQNVPDAFTITSTGTAWAVEAVVVGGIATNYQDSLIFSKGVYNPNTQDFDYTQFLMQFTSDKYISDSKIAFGPDGQTGYISVISHHSFNFVPDSAFYPIVLKTTDGGNTWNDPLYVKLYGPNGIDGIKNYLTDSMLLDFFGEPLIDRDSVLYTTAWENDLVVDADGNPHIAVVVGIGGGGWDIYTTRDYIAMFDIYSPDGGNTWEAMYLDSLKTFDGSWGSGTDAIIEYNRPQAGRSMDGTKVFISWLDTEDPGAEDNISPNIYCRGYNIENGVLTGLKNVTKFTIAYSQAFMGTQSHYALTTPTEYHLPFVYQAFTNNDPTQPVQYKYIHGFKIDASEFSGISVPEHTFPANAVSQNYPNPFSGNTYVELSLAGPAMVGYTVTNLLGKEVLSSGPVKYGAGSHIITLDGQSLVPGLYFASFRIGEEVHSIRMIIR